MRQDTGVWLGKGARSCRWSQKRFYALKRVSHQPVALSGPRGDVLANYPLNCDHVTKKIAATSRAAFFNILGDAFFCRSTSPLRPPHKTFNKLELLLFLPPIFASWLGVREANQRQGAYRMS